MKNNEHLVCKNEYNGYEMNNVLTKMAQSLSYKCWNGWNVENSGNRKS